MNPSFAQLKTLYFYLDTNFERLLAACKTDVERSSLRSSYQTARDNFNQAVNATFEQGEADVQRLTKQAKAINESLVEMQNSLAEIGEIIQIIAKGVALGSELLALGR